MNEEGLAKQLVKAAEAGFPGDREKQIQQISVRAFQMPLGYTGVFLRAIQILMEQESVKP